MEQIFWTEFVKILKYQISWKSVPWEPSFSMRTEGQRTDRRTNIMKLIVAFSKFTNSPKIEDEQNFKGTFYRCELAGGVTLISVPKRSSNTCNKGILTCLGQELVPQFRWLHLVIHFPHVQATHHPSILDLRFCNEQRTPLLNITKKPITRIRSHGCISQWHAPTTTETWSVP